MGLVTDQGLPERWIHGCCRRRRAAALSTGSGEKREGSEEDGCSGEHVCREVEKREGDGKERVIKS